MSKPAAAGGDHPSAPPLRIVIVTYNWPPRNAIGTHRPYAWADEWTKMGATVTVLTAEKASYDEPLDLTLPNPPGVSVVEVPYSNGIGKLANLARRLKVVNLSRSILRKWNRRKSAPIDVRSGWVTAAGSVAADLARNNDVVVSTYGPAASHLIASHMKMTNPNLFWVADYRDLWSQNHTKARGNHQGKEEKLLELKTVGRFSNMIVTVSDEFAENLEKTLQKPITVISNGFDTINVNVSSYKRPQLKIRNTVRIVYTGTIYFGHQDISPVLAAIHDIHELGCWSNCDIRLEIFGGRLDPLVLSTLPSSFRKYLSLNGHVTRDQVLEIQREADLLLLLDNRSEEWRGVVPAKVFEYMVAGVPVISIGGEDDTATDRILKYTGIGVSLYEKEQIKQFLLDMLQGVEPKGYNPNRDRIDEFSRRNQSRELLTKIKVATGREK